MAWVVLKNKASISTDLIGSVGNSGLITRLTKKRLCLAKGFNAVYLVSSSFLGRSGFTIRADQGLFFISGASASAKSMTAMAYWLLQL